MARRDYRTFIDVAAPFKPARHHDYLIAKLQAVADGELPRLMVFMPPGSAKSTYANVYFAPWYLGYRPENAVLTSSYGQDLSDKWGRRSRAVVGSAAYRRVFQFGLSSVTAAANSWETEKGGQYIATSVGGATTGFRADLAIIDDPVKGREDANSPTQKLKAREWYEHELWTRLKPGGAIVLIMTRWAEDDLAGWLLEEQDKGGERWEVLRLPAQAEADDILGRKPGEWLWPEWFKPTMFEEARRDARRWSALYQQRPAPEEGDYFKAEWFHEYDKAPDPKTLRIYGASDYAVTSKGGDWTVHIVVGVDPESRMYVLDLWREQSDSAEWVEAFCDLVREHRPLEWAEESGQIRAAIGPYLKRRQQERKAYVYRRAFPTKADKAVRAQGIRGRMAMQGLYLPSNADWVPEFRRELLTFDAGKHDDQVDALGLIGQLLDHIEAGDAPKTPETAKYEYEAKEGQIFGNVPIVELIERQTRRRLRGY